MLTVSRVLRMEIPAQENPAREVAMEPDYAALERRYAEMGQEKFSQIVRDDLTEKARECYDRELARRDTPEWRALQAQRDTEYEQERLAAKHAAVAAKELPTKLQQSLKDNPIGFIDAETLRTGGSFVWRWFALFSPWIVLAVVAEALRFPPPSGWLAGVIVLGAFGFGFCALGVAEGWRESGAVILPAAAFTGTVERASYCFYWGINSALRLIWIPLVVVVASVMASLDERQTDRLATGTALLLSIPIWGRTARIWQRARDIKNQSESAMER
jgi:hypothetical protein